MVDQASDGRNQDWVAVCPRFLTSTGPSLTAFSEGCQFCLQGWKIYIPIYPLVERSHVDFTPGPVLRPQENWLWDTLTNRLDTHALGAPAKPEQFMVNELFQNFAFRKFRTEPF